MTLAGEISSLIFPGRSKSLRLIRLSIGWKQKELERNIELLEWMLSSYSITPIYDKVHVKFTNEIHNTEYIRGHISVPRSKEKDAFGFIVEGDSMGPHCTRGTSSLSQDTKPQPKRHRLRGAQGRLSHGQKIFTRQRAGRPDPRQPRIRPHDLQARGCHLHRSSGCKGGSVG